MSDATLSTLSLEAFSIRRLMLDVVDESDEETGEASIELSSDFYQHADDENKFRVELTVEVVGGLEQDPRFSLQVVAEAYVEIYAEATGDERSMLLDHAVGLLYSTLRGSLAGVMGQTSIRGFVLPFIDIEPGCGFERMAVSAN